MSQLLMQGEVNIEKLPDSYEMPQKCQTSSHVVVKKGNKGNDHILTTTRDGIISYEKDGVLYVQLLSESVLSCSEKGRHKDINLQPGNYSFTISKEYDPIEDGISKPKQIPVARTTIVDD